MSATIHPFADKFLESLTDDVLDLEESILHLAVSRRVEPLAVVCACIAVAVEHCGNEDGIANLRLILDEYIAAWRDDNPSPQEN